MAQHYFVDHVRLTADEYALLPSLSDPDHDGAMERFWVRVDPDGTRRAEVQGCGSIAVAALDD